MPGPDRQLPLIFEPAALRPDPVVVYFHHIGRVRDHYTSIDCNEFEAALDLLQQSCVLVNPGTGSPGVSPSELPIVVTFDDGYGETLDVVTPILERRGVRAAFFVNTNRVGTTEFVPSLGGSMRFADWPELREASSAGHAIGFHGHRHVSWQDIPLERLGRENSQGLARMRAELGHDAWAGAYPYGRPPNDLPTLEHGSRYFATIRTPAAHWTCRPLTIRRVYLPAREQRIWSRLVEAWREGWYRGICGVCGDSDNRTVDGA